MACSEMQWRAVFRKPEFYALLSDQTSDVSLGKSCKVPEVQLLLYKMAKSPPISSDDTWMKIFSNTPILKNIFHYC